MTFSAWLFSQHPFLVELRRDVLASLEGESSLDDLAIRCRRPSRTVLLALDALSREGKVVSGPAGLRAADPDAGPLPARLGRVWPSDAVPADLRARYQDGLASRPAPGLLWGQRWLTPDSAIERALYTVSQFSQPKGAIHFLGDDDLVSPLVAALAPGWRVHVVDIDRAVLEQARSLAEALGRSLTTQQGDLSQLAREDAGACDAVVCDPFPSGDGSFEALFWRHAAGLLREGGLLLTTVAPSHKPPGYALGALRQLDRLGFCLADLQADYGRYEVFDFEFIPYEVDLMSRLGPRARVSHTKSLLTARLRSRPEAYREQSPGAEFDFGGWSQAALHHYLTVQAGAEQQQRLAKERGPGVSSPPSEAPGQAGLRVDLLFPPDLRGPEGLPGEVRTLERLRPLLAEMRRRHGTLATEDEAFELVRLATTGEIQPNGPLAPLGLAARAIESWERWRLGAPALAPEQGRDASEG